jgi:hypothetical protein
MAFLVGCSSAQTAPEEAPPRQVRRELARLLYETEHLRLTEFRQEAAGQYAATATSPTGESYRVDVKVQGHTLTYEAVGKDRLLHMRRELPEPPFDEAHPAAMQGLRGLAFLLQSLGAVWPALARFGLRRRYSPRTETLLAVFGAVNAAFVAWWVYQIVVNWGVA